MSIFSKENSTITKISKSQIQRELQKRRRELTIESIADGALHAKCLMKCLNGEIAGIRTGNGRAIRQTRRAHLRRKPSEQSVDKILWWSDSTDAEALWLPRKQQWHRILPNHSRIEDQRSVRADFSHQGEGASTGSKSLKIRALRVLLRHGAGRFLDLAFYYSSFVFTVVVVWAF